MRLTTVQEVNRKQKHEPLTDSCDELWRVHMNLEGCVILNYGLFELDTFEPQFVDKTQTSQRKGVFCEQQASQLTMIMSLWWIYFLKAAYCTVGVIDLTN